VSLIKRSRNAEVYDFRQLINRKNGVIKTKKSKK